jgi:glutathione peroxidase
MIDRRTMITAALAAIASPVTARTAPAQGAMSRITAYASRFLHWPGARSGSPTMPAGRC